MQIIRKHMKTPLYTTGFITGPKTVDMVLIVGNIILQGANVTRIHNLNHRARHRFTTLINIRPHATAHCRLIVFIIYMLLKALRIAYQAYLNTSWCICIYSQKTCHEHTLHDSPENHQSPVNAYYKRNVPAIK